MVCATIEPLRSLGQYGKQDLTTCRETVLPIPVKVELVAIIRSYRERRWIVKVTGLKAPIFPSYVIWHRDGLAF